MEQLKHECGVAMIRLLKPLEYYEEKYGTWMYGLNKLYLLMEKQHNRGQEGAGLACVKLEASPGEEYMFRERALGSGAITEIFGTVQGHFKDLTKEQLHDADYAKRVLPFAGEVYMGHCVTPLPESPASRTCTRSSGETTGVPRILPSAATST